MWHKSFIVDPDEMSVMGSTLLVYIETVSEMEPILNKQVEYRWISAQML